MKGCINPYRALEPDESFHSVTDLFGNFRLAVVKKGQSERGELLRYFSGKLGISIPLVAFKVTKLGLDDLYHIKSACDQYAARPEETGGGPWSKAFYGMLKPR